MKTCVYTCITGNYDLLKNIDYIDKEFDYICFTNNNNIKSNFWKVIYINEDIDNWTLARKVKILHHKYLKNYDLTIWIDGSINVLKPISDFIKKECELEKYDMVSFKHGQRDCIYDEMNACILANKESLEKIKRLKDFIMSKNYPSHNGLDETGVLVRKNCKSVNDLMEQWYDMLTQYSNRDQLTFNYVLYLNPIKIKHLNLYVMDNDYFYNTFHYNDSTEFDMMIYYGSLDNFDIENVKHIKTSIKKLKEGIIINNKKNVNSIEVVLSDYNLQLIDYELSNKDIVNLDLKNCLNVGNCNFFYGQPHFVLNNLNGLKKINIKLDLKKTDYKKLTEIYVSLVKDKINLLDTINKINSKRNLIEYIFKNK